MSMRSVGPLTIYLDWARTHLDCSTLMLQRTLGPAVIAGGATGSVLYWHWAQFDRPVAQQLFHLLFVVAMCSLASICLLLDPGRAALMKPDETFTACRICEVLRPPCSHHCRSCGYCVAAFDHHCGLVGHCIGSGNRHVFVLLIASGGMAWCIVGLSTFIAAWAAVHLAWDGLIFPDSLSTLRVFAPHFAGIVFDLLWSYAVGMFYAFAGGLLSLFAMWQLTLLLRGETAHYNTINRSVNSMKPFGSAHNEANDATELDILVKNS